MYLFKPCYRTLWKFNGHFLTNQSWEFTSVTIIIFASSWACVLLWPIKPFFPPFLSIRLSLSSLHSSLMLLDSFPSVYPVYLRTPNLYPLLLHWFTCHLKIHFLFFHLNHPPPPHRPTCSLVSLFLVHFTSWCSPHHSFCSLHVECLSFSTYPVYPLTLILLVISNSVFLLTHLSLSFIFLLLSSFWPFFLHSSSLFFNHNPSLLLFYLGQLISLSFVVIHISPPHSVHHICSSFHSSWPSSLIWSIPHSSSALSHTF